MTIEKAQLEDLESIIALEQQIFNTDAYPAFVVRQLFDISGAYFLVAKEDDMVLGYALGGINTNEKKAWILSLGVALEARGKGLGKQLTETLITVVKAEPIEEIALTVYPDNLASIKIYKELGFLGDLILDNYFLDHEERIIMTLKMI